MLRGKHRSFFLWGFALEKRVIFDGTGKFPQQVYQLALFHGFDKCLFFGKEACPETEPVAF